MTWGDVSEDKAREILRAAYDSGVTFFDTADVYGDGRSERLVGEFVGSLKDARVRVATKVGRRGIYPDGISRQSLTEAVEGCLQRLGVECLDLVQLHCIPTEMLRDGEVFDWMAGIQADGKISQYGASVESLEEAHFCLRDPGVASLQIIFNLFRQHAVTALFPAAAKAQVAIIVRLPLASGLLSGKMTRETKFSEGDHRHFNRDGAAFNVGETFSGLEFGKGIELVEELRGMLPPDIPMAVAAQRWILDQPEVTTMITGATSPGQAAANAAVSDVARLSADLHKRLGEFATSRVHPWIRGPV
ncbi:MAG: aldo/keto reductase [Terrimicrobiaceae bacterium]